MRVCRYSDIFSAVVDCVITQSICVLLMELAPVSGEISNSYQVINNKSLSPLFGRIARRCVMEYSVFNAVRQRLRQGVLAIFIISLGLLTIVGSGGGGGGGGGDDAGSLQFSSASYSVAEGADLTVTVTVTRTGGSKGVASVDYATTDGTATGGSDYAATSGTLNWSDGDSAAKSFTIDIANDSTVELVEAFSVNLSNADTASLGTNSSATISVTDDDSIPIIGTVFGPSGTVAFKTPSLLERMFATIFGDTVNAGVSDLVTPVPGVKVNVYEVDANGDLVGSTPITTAYTDSFGEFTLAAPLDVPNAKYIVCAEGSTEKLDSRIANSQVSVDPSTDATSRMVAAIASDLTKITPTELLEMQQEMEDLNTDIDTAGADATQLSDNFFNEGNNQEAVYNTFRSKASNGEICGNIRTAGGIPLADILVVVRDFANFVTRAKTYTDTNGNYCVNAPVAGDPDPDTGGTYTGEYIIGAINRTDDTNDPDRSASEWYSAGGVSYIQFEGDKITVTSPTPITGINFVLELGARITGTITASDTGGSLEGVKVIVRDYDSRTAVASARTDENGIYSVNVIPGKYLLVASNKTKASYASEVYDAASGSNNRNLGASIG
jgi:hypothetical protein